MKLATSRLFTLSEPPSLKIFVYAPGSHKVTKSLPWLSVKCPHCLNPHVHTDTYRPVILFDNSEVFAKKVCFSAPEELTLPPCPQNLRTRQPPFLGLRTFYELWAEKPLSKGRKGYTELSWQLR